MIGLGFLKSDYIDNQTYHRGGVMLTVGFKFSPEKYQNEIVLMYVDGSIIEDHKIILGRAGIYPTARLDNEEIKELISFLLKAINSSNTKKPDYDSERGISVPVEKC